MADTTSTDFVTAHQFCGRCGARTPSSESSHVACSSCGLNSYNNPTPTVSALIIDSKGEILLGRRANDPFKGTWDIPGGFIEAGETAENALYRELNEELGVQIDSHEYLGSYTDVYESRATLAFFYLVRLKPGGITAADDVTEIKWFSLNQLPPDIKFPSIYQALAEFAQTQKNS